MQIADCSFMRAAFPGSSLIDLRWHDAVQNALFPSVLLTLACSTTFLQRCYLSKNTRLVPRLALELILLATVSFGAVVIVLLVFLARLERHSQPPRDSGAVPCRKLTSPLELAIQTG